MKNYLKFNTVITLLLPLVLFYSAMTTAQNPPLKSPKPAVLIVFDTEFMCPTGAISNQRYWHPGEKITFESSPSGIDFELSFSPFHPVIKSSKGVASLDIVKTNELPRSAKGIYNFTYTVYVNNCEPLDPLIIIER